MEWGKNLKTIGAYAFRSTGLRSLILHEGIDSIAQNAFAYCTKLKVVSIPSSLRCIDGISSGTAGSNSTFYSSTYIDSVYWNAKNCLVNQPFYASYNPRIRVVEFGDSIRYIRDKFCYGFDSLTTVIYPKHVKQIGGYAFYDCDKLTEFTIQDSVTTIAGYAFDGCNNLDSVHVYTTTPPTLGNQPFNSSPACLIPCGTLEAYQNSTWINYMRSIEQRDSKYMEEYVTTCDSYTWNGETYTTSGDYIYMTTAANGCDSVVTLHLTINDSEDATIEYAKICHGETYTWNGIEYSESGEYEVTLSNIYGCDSICILYLTISDEPEIIEDEIYLAYGDEYKWIDGNIYTKSGTYNLILQDISGCDSIIATLYLEVAHEPKQVVDSITICFGEEYLWIDDTFYYESGIYNTILYDEYDRDSIIATLYLTVLPEHNETIIKDTICYEDIYTWHGDTYYYSGEYSITLEDIHGCDSIVSLHLTVLPEVEETIEYVTIFEGESYTWQGQIYTMDGVYTTTLQNQYGCDSLVTLDLTVKTLEIDDDELELLKAIREQLILNNKWKNPWIISEDELLLHGVTTEDGKVTDIDLSYEGLIGKFPTKILQLPYLETLSVSTNNLEGDIFTDIQTDMSVFMKQNSTFTSKLRDLDISYNQFTGNVGVLAMMSGIVPNLTYLTANNNRFKDVIPTLPKELYVDLLEQNIDYILPIHLSNLHINPTQIPTILLYDHKGQSYYTSPLAVGLTNYPLSDGYRVNNWGIIMDLDDASIECLHEGVYTGKTGDTLYLSYPDASVSYGSYCRVILSFDMGDANFIHGVDITDLQSTILYAFGEYEPCAFNHTAANTYIDDKINVQDVIRTVDILLNTNVNIIDTISTYQLTPRANLIKQANAEIVLENNQIKLIADQPIAALRIYATGDIQWNLKELGLELSQANNMVVGYSITGNYIPAGETILGTYRGEATVESIELSDREAHMVSTKISNQSVPSNIENIEMENNEVFYDILGRKHSQLNQTGLYIMKSGNQYVKVYKNNK